MLRPRPSDTQKHTHEAFSPRIHILQTSDAHARTQMYRNYRKSKEGKRKRKKLFFYRGHSIIFVWNRLNVSENVNVAS